MTTTPNKAPRPALVIKQVTLHHREADGTTHTIVADIPTDAPEIVAEAMIEEARRRLQQKRKMHASRSRRA
jgi:hypothetical protein